MWLGWRSRDGIFLGCRDEVWEGGTNTRLRLWSGANFRLVRADLCAVGRPCELVPVCLSSHDDSEQEWAELSCCHLSPPIFF